MCELKIAQLQRANASSTNPSICGEGRLYRSVMELRSLISKDKKLLN